MVDRFGQESKHFGIYAKNTIVFVRFVGLKSNHFVDTIELAKSEQEFSFE